MADKTIFFSVGEPSGDLHGANLIRSLMEIHPGYRFVGYGGPKMKAAGCELHEDLTQLAVMWFLRVLLNLHRFIGLLRKADRYFQQERPDAVVLIDYPGFNWWIARRAKARGIPVFYYGVPQLWGWAPWRIKKMRRLIDHGLCKLPFEEKWFRDRGCNVTYVGHPYFDELANRRLDQSFVSSISSARDSESPLVTLLPGSRDQEITSNLPAFLDVVEKVQSESKSARFAVASFKPAHATKAKDMIAERGLDVEVYQGRTPELIEAADVCLACSGSVSLELLYHTTPSIIQYKISPMAFRLQNRFRIARYITLVNLLETDRIERRPGEHYDPDEDAADSVPMPEYLSHEDCSTAIARRVLKLLTDKEGYERNRERLKQLREKYALPGASQRAAEYISMTLGMKSSIAPPPHFRQSGHIDGTRKESTRT
ncbi:MAG: lipid-A-disaccharide synthase [Planctomycetota bacterium]